MANPATHILKHSDWISSLKTPESQRFSKHVSRSLGLDLSQTAEALNLPKEIDEPFGSYKLAPRYPVQLSFQCPKCGHWKAACKGLGAHPPEWDMRRHLRDGCKAGPFKNFDKIPLSEPCWTYRVYVEGGGSHVFLLPEDWDQIGNNENEELVAVPEFPFQPQAVLSSLLTLSQDWPFVLSWPEYDKEISASDHVLVLRQLIMPPQQLSGSEPDAVEAGLRLIRPAVVKYFRSAMKFIHSKHKSVAKNLTST